jgi:hypothetical protein
MPTRSGVTLVALGALALCGCGANPKTAVRAKVQQFAAASAEHDYATICNQVLAPALTAHLRATGVTCEQAWQLGLGAVKDPTLSIGKVTVKGASASVIVLSLARGQRSSLDAIGLIKTNKGWRIQSVRPYPATTSG